MSLAVETHFNYFSEIEEHYLHRRGGGLILSTLDWALIETWKDAGIPLAAVLRGMDAAFDRYDQRPSKTRKINSLAYCSQEVLAAAEDMKEAAVGMAKPESASDKGFGGAEVSAYLQKNAARLSAAASALPSVPVIGEISATLKELAAEILLSQKPQLESIERHLTVLEEKLYAALLTATSDEELLAIRTAVDRELQPYRSKMPAVQIAQLHKQYTNKRLLEKYNLPRISLFYL